MMRVALYLSLMASVWVLGCDRKPAGPLEEAALRRKQEPLVARGDTSALADLAREQCRLLGREAKQTCYENYFVALSDSGRVRLALGALTALSSKDRQVQSDGHVYTHIIGIRAWAPGRDVGKVFESCTGLFQSGCYHGVIQAYFTSDGSVDSTEVSWFCDLMETTRTNRWLRFQCVHGIGHGLEMAWNWTCPLTQGVRLAAEYVGSGELLRRSVHGKRRGSMPGGHHAPSESWRRGGRAGRRAGGQCAVRAVSTLNTASMPDTEGATPAITFKMRDSADALYPCSIVGPKYWQSATCCRVE
jgi:hypothetical protein